MKLPSIYLVVLIALVLSASAQKIEKPTLVPKESTPEQTQLIREGITLHDRKDYKGAIEKYRRVLAENPDNTLAMYELAFSLYQSGNRSEAVAIAYKGSKYVSDALPLFYQTIANALDDEGKPDDAVKLYNEALKKLKDNENAGRMLASVRYNLGLTLFRQKKYAEARSVLKEAVVNDPGYASPHYLLAEIYKGTGYKVPAWLTAGRLLALEPATQRSARAGMISKDILGGGKKDEKTGNVTINLDLFAPTDEGDFGMYDLIMGTLMTVEDKKDEGKSYEERYANAVDSVIAMLTEDKKLSGTFVGKNYIPFFAAMKKNGHTPAFAYLTLRNAGGHPAAENWLRSNTDKTNSFVNWARTYSGK